MILLTKGQTNTVVLTLTEKSTLTSPVYLFEFVSDTGHNTYTCISADTSLYTYRYNQFTITETDASPDRTNGEITLPESGFYHYTVYEQTSTTNLDPAQAANIVEAGKAFVESPSVDDIEYQPNTEDTIIYES